MTRLGFVKRVKGLISLLLCLTLIVTSVKFPTLASEFDGGSNSNGENEFVSGSFEFPSSQYYNYELKGDFYYNDDYFKNPATTYDEHMATMSLNFALTSFASYFYDVKERSANARALFGKLGFNNVTPNNDYLEEPKADTMGVICANKHIYIKEGTDVRQYNLIAVGMRSSNYKNEWASNFKVGATGDHQGFLEASTIAYNHVKSFYDAHKSDFKANPGDADLPVKFWVVGYSRGAACANLLGGRLTDEAATTFNTTSDNVYVYTFATPQGVSSSAHPNFASYTNIHNILNPQDPVPKVAPSALGFTRYGVNHYISNYVSNNNPSHEAINQDYLNRKPDVLRRLQLIDPGLKMTCENFMVKDFTIMGAGGIMYTKDRGGKPSSTVRDNYKQGEFFDYAMDFLVNEVMSCNWPGKSYTTTGRQRYYECYQEPIRRLAEMVLKLDTNGMKELVSKVKANAGKDTMALLRAAMSLMGCVSNNQPRTQDVYNNIGNFLVSVLDGAIATEDLNYIKSDKVKIVDLLLDILTTDQKRADFTIVGSVYGNGFAFLEGHGPEYLLAWLQNRDTYYTTPPVDNDYDDGYKAIVLSNIENTTINIFVGTDLNTSIVGDASGNYTINRIATNPADFRFIRVGSPQSYELQFSEPYDYVVEVMSTAADGTEYNTIGYHDKFAQDEATAYRNDVKVNNVKLLDGEKLTIDLNPGYIVDVSAAYPWNNIPTVKRAYYQETEINKVKYGYGVTEFPYAVIPKMTKSVLVNAVVKKASDGSDLPAGGNFTNSYFITQDGVKENIDLTGVVYKDIDLFRKEKAYVVVKNNVSAGHTGVKTYNDFNAETKTATEMNYNIASIYEVDPSNPNGVYHVLEVNTTTGPTTSSPEPFGTTESTSIADEPETDASESTSESTTESITESESTTETTIESSETITTEAEGTTESSGTIATEEEGTTESSGTIATEEEETTETSETTTTEAEETTETSETTEETTESSEEVSVSGFNGTFTAVGDKYVIAVPAGNAKVGNDKILYAQENTPIKITITDIPNGKKLTKIKVFTESGNEQEFTASLNTAIDYTIGTENIYVQTVLEDKKSKINFDGSGYAKIYDDTGATELPSSSEQVYGTEVIIKAPWFAGFSKKFLGWTILDSTGKLINDREFMSAIQLNNSDETGSNVHIKVPNFDMKIKAIYIDATEEEEKLNKHTLIFNDGSETSTTEHFITHAVGLVAKATKSNADPKGQDIPLQSFKLTYNGETYYLAPSDDVYYEEGITYKGAIFKMPDCDVNAEAIYSFEPIPDPPTPPEPTPPGPTPPGPSPSGSDGGSKSGETVKPPAGFMKNENENHEWDGNGVVWRVKDKRTNDYVKNTWVNLYYKGALRWYYFGDDTVMRIGWINYNKHFYYLQTSYNDTFGAMLTGIQVIDGKTYEFTNTGELVRQIN